MTNKTPSSQAVRAGGNLALTVCLFLSIIDAVNFDQWVTVMIIGLTICGTGARIEAAIRETHEFAANKKPQENIE